MRVAAGVVVGALALALPGAGEAHAAEVSAARLRALARRAQGNAEALARLRDVEIVSGERFDVSRALAGARGAELSARLETLAEPSSGAPVEPGAARARARAILERPRYRFARPPRPFEGLLRWLARAIEPVVGPAVRLVLRVLGLVQGSGTTGWALLAAAVVALSAWATARSLRRRAHAARSPLGPRADRRDPAQLEAAADAAEGAGDLVAAIRLRWHAGLLRLGRAGALQLSPSLTAREVARRLGSSDLDRLALAFDEIVYGGRSPRPDDVAETRAAWARALQEAAA